MKTLFWRVLIELRPVEEKSAGGILIGGRDQEAELLQTCVGRVLELGPLAFATKTNSGADYAVHKDDVTVGTWVLMSKKIGVPIEFKDGRRVQLINDYEILATLTEEEAMSIKAYL